MCDSDSVTGVHEGTVLCTVREDKNSEKDTYRVPVTRNFLLYIFTCIEKIYSSTSTVRVYLCTVLVLTLDTDTREVWKMEGTGTRYLLLCTTTF